MREFDDARLERLLRDTLHAEADHLPVTIDAEMLAARWRRRAAGRTRRRTLTVLGVAALLLVPVGLLAQGGAQPRVAESPSVSPGGSGAPVSFDPAAYPGWLAYSVGGAGPAPGFREVRLVRTDGTGDHGIQVPATEPWDEAEWTPDGDALFLMRERRDPRVFDIFRYDLTTGTSEEVVHCDHAAIVPCAQVNEAAVSPDGLRLGYFYAEGLLDAQGIPATCGIRILTLADGSTEDATRHACGEIEDRHPRWSPDGSRLAFYRTQ